MNGFDKPGQDANSAIEYREQKYLEAKANPSAVRVINVDTADLDRGGRGFGAFEFVNGEWVCFLGNVDERIRPHMKVFYVLLRSADTDMEAYERLEDLPGEIEDLEVRIKFLVTMIVDFRKSNPSPAMERYRDTFLALYTAELRSIEKIEAILSSTGADITQAAE